MYATEMKSRKVFITGATGFIGCRLAPVVVSSCRPLRRIIEETGAGLIFQSGDPKDLAENIITLYESPELRQKLGKRGRKAAVAGKYSWKYSAEELIRIYNNLTDKTLSY